MVVPRLAASVSASSSARALSWSSSAVGSSTTTIGVLRASATASDARASSPPESCEARASRRCAIPSRSSHPPVSARKVLGDGQVREEVVGRALGDERHLRAAKIREWPRRSAAGEIDAVRDHAPARRRLEPCEQPQQRRLTAARDADERGHRRARDLGVDVVQSLDDAGLHGIALADVLDEQHRLRQRAAPLRLRRGSRMLRRRRRPGRPRARAVQRMQRAATRARRGAPTACTAAVDRRAR